MSGIFLPSCYFGLILAGFGPRTRTTPARIGFMTRNTFTLGKLVVIGLALSIPLVLFRSLESRISSARRDVKLQSYFGDERDNMVLQVLERQLQSGLWDAHVLYERPLPDGPIIGLPPFPKEALLKLCQVREAPIIPENLKFYQFLHQDGSFPSGMPIRYAGWLEIAKTSPIILGSQDQARFLEVAEQFWQGIALNNSQMLFLLLEKLNPELRPLFSDHLLFLGEGSVPADGRIWLEFALDETMKLAALPNQERQEINRDLMALGLNMALQPVTSWTDLGSMRVSLAPVTLPLEQRIRKEWILHGALFLIFELVCLLIYSILHKYQKVHRLQKQLLASTSHELRTPLAVIRQFSEMLIIRPERFTDKVQNYHHYIYRESLKLQFLVENLLSAAKFENLGTTPRPVPLNLSEWLHEEVDALQHVVGDHHIRVTTETLQVHWDPGLISQVLTNLVDNAAKHAGTDMEVSATAVADRVHLIVRDFGEEVSLERIGNIRAFQSQSTKKTSLGLGLFIAQKIAATHQGQLQFEKAEPGLRVILDLPRQLELG